MNINEDMIYVTLIQYGLCIIQDPHQRMRETIITRAKCGRIHQHEY